MFSNVCCGWLSSPTVSHQVQCPLNSGASLLICKSADSCGLKRDFNQTSPSDYFFSFLELSGGLCGFSRSKSLSQVNHSQICWISQVFEVVGPQARRVAPTEYRLCSSEGKGLLVQSDRAYRTSCVRVSSVSKRPPGPCSGANPLNLHSDHTEQVDQPQPPLPKPNEYHNWCRDNLGSRQLVFLLVEIKRPVELSPFSKTLGK